MAIVSLRGQGVARGYAIGRAVVMDAAVLEVAHHRIAEHEVEAECARLHTALQVAQQRLSEMARALPADTPAELGAVLNVHALLLADPELERPALKLIRERHYNAEWALTACGSALGEQFAQMEDAYLRERATDIRQAIERVLMALVGADADILCAAHRMAEHHDEPLIVVAHDIAPADMLHLREGRFAAFVTDLGGPTSHTAIVARSMGVPAVVAVGNARTLIRDGDQLVVDGATGGVIINPSAQVLEEYRQRKQQFLQERAELALLSSAPAVTLDGVAITLNANIELPDEAAAACRAGAEGVGLFRTEFLFMGRNHLPDEEEQYRAYAEAVKGMAGRPVTIRTLDIGADKSLLNEPAVATNPALGLRAIRYCLAHPDIFATQLRAILRASAHGQVRILIPMVAHMHEVHATRQALASAKAELVARGQPFDDQVQLGAMVEIPATAIAIEPFAENLDFLSIGTNDLIQYTLAIDRGDTEVAHLYDSQHPAVLRLIAQTINAGVRYGKPVAVCGEMAGDATLTRLLLGMGLTQFSMHASQMLEVKREIRSAHSNALRAKVAIALNRAERVDLKAL